MTSHAHASAPPLIVRCAIVTISDTRSLDTDKSGAAIADLLAAHGHQIVHRAVVPDDIEAIRVEVLKQVDKEVMQVVITTGGTGIAARDCTFEALTPVLDLELAGFGELFRMLSYQDIGPGAMLSRAFAGIIRRRLVVCLPGSEAAVRLAMTKLVLPELNHLIREVTK